MSKKGYAILNVFLMQLVLLVVLVQSIHMYEHVPFHDDKIETIDQKHGSYVENHAHNHEKCSICDFTFSSFTSVEFLHLDIFQLAHIYKKTSQYTSIASTFCVSANQLRGPPMTTNC